jgi:type IV pilus assembly protein PilN
MIKINLLPHREAKRQQQKKDFYSLLMLFGIVGVLIIILVGSFYSVQIAAQNEKNNFIKAENQELDKKIAEVATLKQEIDALKARQQAVEDLQGDRNQPVFMLSELIKLTPEGVYLKTLKQNGQRVELVGVAQSSERVADFLKNLSDQTKPLVSPWFHQPTLNEIKGVTMGQGRDARRVAEFSMSVGIKRPREVEAAAASEAAGNIDSSKRSTK